MNQKHALVQNADDERLEEIAAIAREGLEAHYKERFVFDVEVHREFDVFGDGDGEPYLKIEVICDTVDLKQLEDPWLLDYLTMLRNRLMEVGVEEFPVTSFFSKPEWERMKRPSGPS